MKVYAYVHMVLYLHKYVSTHGCINIHECVFVCASGSMSTSMCVSVRMAAYIHEYAGLAVSKILHVRY